MSHAELCPICRGKGKIASSNYSTVSESELQIVCHGCDGKGWVVVYDGDYKVGYSGGTRENVIPPC